MTERSTAATEGRVKLNVAQAAELLDAHPETVRKWIRRGKVPAYRIGELGDYILYKDDLEALVGLISRQASRRKAKKPLDIVRARD